MSFQKLSKIILVCVIAVVFTSLLLFNHIFPLNGLPSGYNPDDPACIVWSLYTVNERIKAGENPFHTDMVFYPVGGNLAHHGHVSGFFPVTFLVDRITGGSLYYPFYSYHISLLLSYSMLVLFCWMVLRELGYRGFATVIPAIGYSFCTFFGTHAVQLNYAECFLIPLNALLLIVLFKRPTALNAIISAVALSTAVYFTEVALYIYMTVAVLFAVVLFCPEERRTFFDRTMALGYPKILVMLVVFAAIMFPFLSNFLFYKVVSPLSMEYSAYSANIIDFFIPRQQSTPFYGTLFAPVNAKISAALTGHETFIGYPLMLAAGMSFFISRKRIVRISGIMALIFFVLSLGPDLKVMNGTTDIHLPYRLLMHVPPFSESRTPVRFVVVGMFFLMIAAAGGLDSAERPLIKSVGKRPALVLMSLLLLWTVAESYRPAERLKVFQIPHKLEGIVKGPVLNLPLIYKDGRAAMLQTIHKQPIGTGYLARLSDANVRHFRLLKDILEQPPEVMCEKLKGMGYKNIIMSDGISSRTATALSGCGINNIDLRTEH